MAVATQRQILSSLQGVWEGTYVTTTPEGEVVDRFASRQELRLVGEHWYERIVYLRPGREPEVHDFRAAFDDAGNLIFDDERLEGTLYTATDDSLLFIYRWKNEPDVWIRELLSLHLPDAKLRLWQRTEGDELVSLTVIREHRRHDLEPADWR